MLCESNIQNYPIRPAKYHWKGFSVKHIYLHPYSREYESVLYSRPFFSVIYTNIDSIHILIPSYIFNGYILHSVPNKPPSYAANYKDRWELVQNIRQVFYKPLKEDLLSLQPKQKCKKVT